MTKAFKLVLIWFLSHGLDISNENFLAFPLVLLHHGCEKNTLFYPNHSVLASFQTIVSVFGKCAKDFNRNNITVCSVNKVTCLPYCKK